MSDDDYSDGKNFWIHFWCGLVIGAGVGVWISSGIFENGLAILGLAAAIALLFALCAGKWGDPFWYWFLDLWRW